jgi:hypothetical protein
MTMAKYPLAPLMSARLYREDAAKRETLKAFYATREAQKIAKQARDELKRYQKWRPEEEKRLFEKIRGKVVPQSELDAHREDIQRLRTEEIEKEKKAAEADKAAAKALEHENAMRAAQIVTIRDREKIMEHQRRWLDAERKREEAAEEKELEEFVARRLEMAE